MTLFLPWTAYPEHQLIMCLLEQKNCLTCLAMVKVIVLIYLRLAFIIQT